MKNGFTVVPAAHLAIQYGDACSSETGLPIRVTVAPLAARDATEGRVRSSRYTSMCGISKSAPEPQLYGDVLARLCQLEVLIV